MPFVSKELELFSKHIINKAVMKQIPTATPEESLVERLRKAALRLQGR